MSFSEKLFGWRLGKNEPTDNYTHMFGVWHFLILALIIGAIVAICLISRKKDKAWHDRFFKTVAIILLVLEGLRIMYRAITCYNYDHYPPENSHNIYNPAEVVSFALCTMITFFTAITLLVNKPRWNAFAYDSIFVIGLLGGGAALIYPDMLNTYYPIYHVMNVQTLVTHGLIVTVPIMLIVTGRLKLDMRNCWKPFVTIACFAFIARMFSVASDSSFMYMNGFELLPGWGDKPLWQYIWILIGAFALWTALCYLPQIIINAVRKKSAAKQEESPETE